MSKLLLNKHYRNAIEYICSRIKFCNSSILITGASGLIGTILVDSLILNNEIYNSNNEIIVLGRNRSLLMEKFSENDIIFLEQDIKKEIEYQGKIDFIIHAASNSSPDLYISKPVDTIDINFIGTTNVIKLALEKRSKIIYTSTFEVYGKNDYDMISENDFGALDINNIRSCYTVSKALCEILLKSYKQSYNLDFNIARLPSVYGPTMINGDRKAHAQFLNNALKKENIILKSEGIQKRTYLTAFDVADALFYLITEGLSGECYNISDLNCVSSIKDVAYIISCISGVNVEFQVDRNNKNMYFRPYNSVLNPSKVNSLGWRAKYNLHDGLELTYRILEGIDKYAE